MHIEESGSAEPQYNEYYGRRFEILRDGRIQFTGGPEIDPALDVTARRIIEPSGVEARIRVQEIQSSNYAGLHASEYIQVAPAAAENRALR